MSRVKLLRQESYEFLYRVSAEIVHVNFAGHVGHDAIIAMVWQARVRMFRLLGATERDLGDNETGIVMGDLVVNFTGEAFLFEELEIESHIGDITPVSFRLFHRISREERQVALVETGCVAFNYGLRNPAPIPAIFLKSLEDYRAVRQGV